MTTKTQPKPERPSARPTEEMQAAYECHTLAQLLYGYIAATHPWVVQTPFSGAMPPTPGAHTTPWSTGWSGIEYPSMGGIR